VAGVGKVGRHLVGHLVAEGAQAVVTDVDERAVDRVRTAHPGVEVVPDADALVRADLDAYAPCALGGALTDEVVAVLRARVVCGGANNQLAHPGVAEALAARGVLYAPDFVVNAGGVIQVAEEVHGYVPERARARAERIGATTRRVLELAEEHRTTPVVAAERLAEERMAGVARLRDVWLPH
jgi:valine dehydrogenase (NAD+)